MDACTQNAELRLNFLAATKGKCVDCTDKSCGHDQEKPLDAIVDRHLPAGRMPDAMRQKIENCLHMPTHAERD
jgi:hypothetical protein